MEIKFDMQKATEALVFTLEKVGVGTIIPCQVHMVMDTSYSFKDEHERGYTQQLLNRFVPFAMLFDLNRSLDSYAFSSRAVSLPDITERNFENYIKKHVVGSDGYGNGTNYAPAFRLMVESSQESLESVLQAPVAEKPRGFLSRIFGGKSTEAQTSAPAISAGTGKPEKHLHFFITDGEPQDDAEHVLSSLLAQNPNVFVVFLSVSNRPVRYLEDMAERTVNTSYINLTLSELHNLPNVTDEEMYSQLLADQSLVDWMNK